MYSSAIQSVPVETVYVGVLADAVYQFTREGILQKLPKRNAKNNYYWEKMLLLNLSKVPNC